MKNTKSLKGNFIAKFCCGLVFILSSFITIFCFVCIIFLTASGGFDSSKNAAITSMRDSLYYQVIQNYRDDAIDLCVFGEKDVSIFDNTNFRFRVTDEIGFEKLSNCKASDGDYIYKISRKFSYPIEYTVYNDETQQYCTTLYPRDYTIECYVDGKLQNSDQFALINDFIYLIYQLRFIAILICIVGAFATIVSFVFLMSASGYHDNAEAPKLSWFDKIYLELIILAILLLAGLEIYILDGISVLSIAMAIWAIFIVLFDTTLLLLVCMSLATRLRCRSFWKTTLIYTILHWLFMLFVKILSYIPSMWKLILAIGGFGLAEIFLIMLWGKEEIIVLFFFEKCIFIPLIFYFAVIINQLENTSKKLALGDMSATVNTKYFVGPFKRQGNHLNSIKLGISQAVEDKMKSERFKTELITNVSHDIKTPLTSIINYVDLLSKEDLQNETAEEYIQIISKNSDRLKKLVVDLVDASKASSGVLQLDMQPLNIDVLLEQIGGEYLERLNSNHLELIMRKPEESIRIMADGQRIYRIFDNLLNNICKYAMPNTRVYLLLEKQGEKAVISFKNISATELDISANDLMERFVRGDKSRNTEGSGLGLSIAESLTKLQNGEFQIQIDGDLFKIVIAFPIIE